MHDRAPLSAPTRPTPLWGVYAFTFLNSIGTGVGTSGIYFLTTQGYGFSAAQNYLLGIILGATYILGALGTAPLLRLLRRRTGASSRGLLAALMVVGAGLCAVPYVTIRVSAGPPPVWPIWLMGLAYSPLTGVLWPTVESYLSGGRSGAVLRSAVGTWNLVWSGALVFAFWGIAPFVEARGSESAAEHAAAAILALALVHVVALGVLAAFEREPAPHPAVGTGEPHPEVYGRLLTTFRVLLPTSYLVSSALSPFLPSAIKTLAVPLGIAPAWFTVLASAWLLPRALGFLVLERWHGWHGRWAMPVVGAVLMFAGFSASFMASRVASGAPGLALQLAGLAAFGVGMATIYCGAIYYALEVGRAEVEAGGTHEALIGVGYTVGPLCGFGAAAGVGTGADSPFEYVVMASVGSLALLASGWAVLRSVRASTPTASSIPGPNRT